MTKQTHHLEYKWTTSRGRDTYGYNICTLYVDGQKVARCNGGGYDMQGTVLGDYLARAFPERLRHISTPPAETRVTCPRCEGTRKRPIRYTGNTPVEVVDCTYCDERGTVENDAGAFYGLTFHDPNYDPGQAIIGRDTVNTVRVDDRTIGQSAGGMTVSQAEAGGVSFGLERYQAIYSGSSRWPTERHTIPSIDGAVGLRSVEKIAEAIGVTFETLPGGGKNLTNVLMTVQEMEVIRS